MGSLRMSHMFWTHTSHCPTLFPSNPFSVHPTLFFGFVLDIFIKTYLCYPNTFGHAAFYWRVVKWSGTTLTENCLSPCQQQWACAHSHSYWDLVWLGPVQILCTVSQPLWIHLCIAPAVSRRCCSLSYDLPLAFTIASTHPLFHNDPWAWGGYCAVFVVHWSLSIPYPLHLGQLQVSVLVTTYCK